MSEEDIYPRTIVVSETDEAKVEAVEKNWEEISSVKVTSKTGEAEIQISDPLGNMELKITTPNQTFTDEFICTQASVNCVVLGVYKTIDAIFKDLNISCKNAERAIMTKVTEACHLSMI